MESTRREALITIAAVAVASPALGQSTFLSAPELEWLKALVDAIIPRTDTPSASDAGVPLYIDRRLTASPELGERFRTGMAELEADAQSKFGASFPELPTQKQIELLTPRAEAPFFRMIKGMTVDGYYTSKEGLTQELGWHGNTFLTEFKGCTHPEHQS